MARVTGLARRTIYRGLHDIRNNHSTEPGRVRKKGAGRKKKTLDDPSLLPDRKRLVEPTTRGDPTQPLLWTCRSLRNLAKALADKGHKVSPTLVGNLLREIGYSLQANRKTKEGTQHIDRESQFRYINEQAKAFLRAGQPVISVDTKKKELVGNFRNNGREWRPQGQPEDVEIHDFIDPKLSRAVPFGVYDIHNNTGWVSVGTDHDTASFAVNAVRRWWRTMGKKTPSQGQTSDGHRRQRREQRLSRAALEDRASTARQRAQISNYGLPPAPRYQQVEQDRASSVFVHHY